MTLEQACGLYERVSFLYVVDGYLCSLTDHEGMRELFTAKGETMQEAMDKLAELVRPFSSKEEMKKAAQIRIEAEALGARIWQAGREISMIPDLEMRKGEDRVVRVNLTRADLFNEKYGKPYETKEQAVERITKTLEALRIKLMDDEVEMTITDQCGRCGRFYLAGRDHDCVTDHD